jgi:hypothetical protein
MYGSSGVLIVGGFKGSERIGEKLVSLTFTRVPIISSPSSLAMKSPLC